VTSGNRLRNAGLAGRCPESRRKAAHGRHVTWRNRWWRRNNGRSRLSCSPVCRAARDGFAGLGQVMKKRIVIGFAAVFAVAIIASGVAFYRIVAATHGPRIASDARETALLVVDVQEDYTGPNAKQSFREATRLLSTVNRLTRAAAERGWRVVFIRNEMPDEWFYRRLSGGTAVRGTPGVRIDTRLERPVSSREIPKSRSDAFSNADLDQYLRSEHVGRLLVTGLDAAFCVRATTGGARNRGYETIVVQDAIATESGKSLAELSEAYRAMGAMVQSSDGVLAQGRGASDR
jgi:nicotinamidase-related amidase